MNTPLGRLCSVLLLLCGLAACVSSPQPQPDGRETRVSSEPADPERRARVRLELAGLYFGRGQNTTALDEIKLALAARPDMPEAFSLRGLVYAAMGDAGRADESFQRALQLAPADASGGGVFMAK